jgi:RNA polymerase sigma-32 factor
MTNYLPILSSESELSSYLNKINAFAYLSEEEEKTLAISYRNGNIKDAEQLVTSHLRLVAKIAFGYRNYGLSMMDLICEGNLGLMQAVKKFDVTKGYRLSTYAMWWIKAYIQDYILKSFSLVKIGTSSLQKKLFFNLAKVKQKLKLYDENQLASNIESSSVIADELGIDEKYVKEMDMRLSSRDVYLNDKTSDEDSTELIDLLPDHNDDQEVLYIKNQEQSNKTKLLNNALASLNPREQYIIQNRKLAEKPVTLDEISNIYNISKERVRQIEARAMQKLSQFVQAS